MRKLIRSFKSLPVMVSLISSFALAACYNETPAEEEMLSGGSSKLSIVTRSMTGNSVHYPLAVYAFDSEGMCRAEKMIEDESEPLSLKLAEGAYRVTAVAGFSGFPIPDKVRESSVLQANSSNYATSPLTIGQADVSVSGSPNVTLHMSLQVASVDVELSGLPEDVSDVSISISSVYSCISFGGELSNPQKAVVKCSKNDGIWSTGRFYVLPSSSTATVLSINIKDDAGSQTYGYTYNARLKAGVPYVLKGTFSSGYIDFNGTVETKGWDDEVVLDFNFGPSTEDVGGNYDESEDSSKTEYVVSEIPAPCSVWDGHAVALVSDAGTSGADLLLVSLSEEDNVLSKQSSNPDDAVGYASSYSENGLTGWHIPTKAEATMLKNMYYGDNIAPLNQVIEQEKGKPIVQVDSKGKNVRYLCEDAIYTYSFATSSDGNSLSVSKAGAKVKYHLRLVKTVHVRLSVSGH